jgi:DNA-binding NarL/FixJ family response regulator
MTQASGAGDESGLTILLIDRRQPRRSATVAALRASGCFKTIYEVTRGEDTSRLAAAIAPDLVMLETDRTELGVGPRIRSLLAAAPTARIVVLTAHECDEFVLEALEAGAAGVLGSDIAGGALIRTLIGVATGEAAVSRRCATWLLQRARQELPRRVGMRPVRSSLTPREWEVLDLLAAGTTQEGVARALGVTVGTVRSHLREVGRKLRWRERELRRR